jgi:hypothetical protein
MRVHLSPPRVLLPHTCTQDGSDGFCNQNADQLCYLAGPSLLTVYVGVEECASDSPYTYSSSSHRFPSVRLSRLRLFHGHLWSLVWVWVWVLDWIHSHTPPRTCSPSSRHPPFTHYPFPLCSLVCGGQPSPHKPLLVVSHSTCPPLSSSPHEYSFVFGTAVINTTSSPGLGLRV